MLRPQYDTDADHQDNAADNLSHRRRLAHNEQRPQYAENGHGLRSDC